MADDLQEAEAAVWDSIGNDPYGYLLIRLVRQVRLLRTAVKGLDDRLKVLENPTPPVP